MISKMKYHTYAIIFSYISYLCVSNTALGQQKEISPLDESGRKIDFAKSSVVTEETIPSHLPVFFWVFSPNTSDQAVSQTIFSPGKYAGANEFSLSITQDGGKARTVQPQNGQATQGRAGSITIQPGQSLRTPMFIEGLSSGNYMCTLSYRGPFRGLLSQDKQSNPVATFQFAVVDDEMARKAWIENRIAEMRAGDSVAPRASVTYRVDEVIQAMLDDIMTDNDQVANYAAWNLWRLRPRNENDLWSQHWGDRIDAGLKKHLNDKPVLTKDQRNFISSLLHAAQIHPEDRFLPHILQYARKEQAFLGHDVTLTLQAYKQSDASDLLADIAMGKLSGDRSIAAMTLCTRNDERGVIASALLLKEKSIGGVPHFEALVIYPDNETAMQVVNDALKSSDESVRRAAEIAVNSKMPFIDPTGRKPLPDEIKNLTIPDAMKTLLDCTEFEVIDNITAQNPSKVILSYRAMLGTYKYGARSRLLSKNSLAGKLYGLCYLFLNEKEEMLKWAAKLESEGGEVVVIDGQEKKKMTVKEILPKIISGEYPQRLSKLYQQQIAPSTQPKT